MYHSAYITLWLALPDFQNYRFSVADLMIHRTRDGKKRPPLFAEDPDDTHVTRLIKALVIQMTEYKADNRASIEHVVTTLQQCQALANMMKDYREIQDINGTDSPS